MNYDPSAIDLLAHQVLNCLCVELDRVAEAQDDLNQPGCPCRISTTPGTAAWDECCGCTGDSEPGQLTVSVSRIFPTARFPLEDRSLDLCAPYTLAVEFTIVLLRCAPTYDDKGNPPSTDKLTTAARIQTTDMLTMMHAATCCAARTTAGKKRRVAISQHRSVGPQGGCVGSELVFVVDSQLACHCPSEEAS